MTAQLAHEMALSTEDSAAPSAAPDEPLPPPPASVCTAEDGRCASAITASSETAALEKEVATAQLRSHRRACGLTMIK